MTRIYRRFRLPLGLVLSMAALALLAWSVLDARPAAFGIRIVMLSVAVILQAVVCTARTLSLFLDFVAHAITAQAIALALGTVPAGAVKVVVILVVVVAIGAAIGALVAHTESTNRPPLDRL